MDTNRPPLSDITNTQSSRNDQPKTQPPRKDWKLYGNQTHRRTDSHSGDTSFTSGSNPILSRGVLSNETSIEDFTEDEVKQAASKGFEEDITITSTKKRSFAELVDTDEEDTENNSSVVLGAKDFDELNNGHSFSLTDQVINLAVMKQGLGDANMEKMGLHSADLLSISDLLGESAILASVYEGINKRLPESLGDLDPKIQAEFSGKAVVDEAIAEVISHFSLMGVSETRESKGYEADNENRKAETIHTPVKADRSHKRRLLLGEADFSFAVALIDKHPSIAKFITATTYEDGNYLSSNYPQTGPSNKKKLIQRGVTVLHNIDATKLDTYQNFVSKKFGHIHFNFPHDGGNYKTSATSFIISQFFKSARKVLIENGHVHMALVSRDWNSGEPAFYHGRLYKIAEGTLSNGFSFKKKHKFNKARYPGYAHKMTASSQSVDHVENNGREHVFEKIDSDDEETIAINNRNYRMLPKEGNKKYLLGLQTDSESSDYGSE